MRTLTFAITMLVACGKGGDKQASSTGSGSSAGSAELVTPPPPPPPAADAAPAPATFTQTITATGVGPITANTDGKTIASLFPGLDAKVEHAEGEDHSYDTTTLSQGGTKVLDVVVDNFSKGRIFRVDVWGSRFPTAAGIRIGSTVAEFATAYPDGTCTRATYNENAEGFDKALICEVPSLPGVAFYLDPKALKGPDGKVAIAKLAALRFERIIWLAAPPTAADSGPAPAATAGKPFCFGANKKLVLDRISATDDTVTFCTKGDVKACVTAQLATGVLTGATTEPPAAPADAPMMTSADGKRRVSKSAKAIVIYEGDTDKKIAGMTVGDPEFKCFEGARFLGSTIYATASLCNKPRSAGWLFDQNGEPIGDKLDGVNLQGAVPFHVDGDRWAFRSADSEDVLVVDVKTGKATPIKTMTPDQVGKCCDVNVAAKIAPFVRTPSGKLVEVGAAVVVIDPASGKPEHVSLLESCNH